MYFLYKSASFTASIPADIGASASLNRLGANTIARLRGFIRFTLERSATSQQRSSSHNITVKCGSLKLSRITLPAPADVVQLRISFVSLMTSRRRAGMSRNHTLRLLAMRFTSEQDLNVPLLSCCFTIIASLPSGATRKMPSASRPPFL